MGPEITVIVPYHNERTTIEFTLERVGTQTLPAQVALFVNSSSTDDTSDVVDDWIRKNQHRFATRFINVFEHTDNPASSKNAGVRRARTEWVAFMDCGQDFPTDWLERQYRFAQEHGFDIVSGVVYLTGQNWVDRCAIAQTYGYKRLRPCIPTTLARMAVFEKAGAFLERRSGYDLDWALRLKKLAIERGINEAVRIQYIGFNFSSNLAHLWRKSMLYAKPSVAISNYREPYIYAVAPLVFVAVFALSVKAAAALFAFYILARTFLFPIVKSRGIAFFREHPGEAALGLSVTGLIIDSAKAIGTWQGIHQYFLRPHLAAR